MQAKRVSLEEGGIKTQIELALTCYQTQLRAWLAFGSGGLETIAPGRVVRLGQARELWTQNVRQYLTISGEFRGGVSFVQQLLLRKTVLKVDLVIELAATDEVDDGGFAGVAVGLRGVLEHPEEQDPAVVQQLPDPVHLRVGAHGRALLSSVDLEQIMDP